MKEVIEEYLSFEELDNRTKELALQISEDYQDKDIYMICILKGGVTFMVDLARYITQSVEFDFMDVSSYGDETKSSGKIEIKLDTSGNLDGKHVLIVEDIIDSGRTLSFLYDYLRTKNPASIKICTLLDKHQERIVDVFVDYVGFKISNAFVVGYGLDYAQKYRNLNYIGVLSFQ